MDNLLQVNQSGIAARTFAYDSLSRLLTASNSESGSISYAYDANGNLFTKTSPAPNQTGSGTVTTTYQYDALNRTMQRNYNDTPTTPTATFTYDCCNGNFTNLVGRLYESTVGTGNLTATYSSYDAMGRIKFQQQNIPYAGGASVSYGMPYTYDLMGNMTAAGSGHCNCTDFTYTYNSVARLNALNFSIWTGVLSGAHYDAAGRLTSDVLYSGETESWTYNKRGWPVSTAATLNTTSIYSYNVTSFAPNGDILAANDSANANWTYSYDALNRLVGSNKNSGQAVYSYVYDRFGNRWQQNGPNSMQLTFTGNNPSNPQNNNRMDGYTYDAAGNLLNDGSHQYFYDGQNHLIQVDGSSGYCSSGTGTSATACYFYDANGHRVRDTANSLLGGGLSAGVGFTYDLSGRWVMEVSTASGGGPWAYEIYAGSRHVAHDSGSLNYSHVDWLGTERARTGPYGYGNGYGSDWRVCESTSSLPFGDGQVTTFYPGNGFANGCYHDSTLHFTGKERDAESGLDNFGARYNSSSMGRFMSPDPANAGAFNDSPQSWNAYSYVSNNPLNATDPDGLDCVYLSDDQKSATVKTGDCKSDTDNGIFVDGTVNSLSLSVSNQGDVLNIGFRPGGGGDLTLHPENLGQDASGLSAGVYDFHP